MSLHSQERLLQEARALQARPAFKKYKRMRQTSGHRLARMIQLGVRKALFFGRHKTLFQALMAATIANLTLIAKKMGDMECEAGRKGDMHLLFSDLSRLGLAVMDYAVAGIHNTS